MLDRRSRLAPSPTGALHIGNAYSFLINCALAKQQQWELIFRLEDIDGPRKKPDSMQESEEIFHWLGLEWTGEIYIQSTGFSHSKQTLNLLVQKDKSYHCTLSRSELALASSAPHTDDALAEYCQRPENIALHNKQSAEGANWRFVASGTKQTLHDEIQGDFDIKNETDFVLWTKANIPSYQLAVVVDDHRQGITDVVRGRDLLESASWQEEIYKTLGWNPPRWWHLPLIVGEDGKRLAKRHGDSRLSSYKRKGVSPERVIGLIASWCGIQHTLLPMQLETFYEQFAIEQLPKENSTFTSKEEQWLLDS